MTVAARIGFVSIGAATVRERLLVACLLLLPQIDGAVVGLERSFRAAAVDGAGDGAVHLHFEFAVGRIVLLGDDTAA